MLGIFGEGWLYIAAAAIHVIIVVVAAFTLGHNRRPTTAVAWLLTIGLIPYIGLLLFWMFGSTRLPEHRRRKQAQFNQLLHESTVQLEQRVGLTELPTRFQHLSQLARELTAIPHLPGNRIRITTSYDATIREMADEIDTAQNYVHLLFYALAADEVTEPVFVAIERALQRGVKVRVAYDQFGSMRYRDYRHMKRRLQAAGCDWHQLYSIWPWRNGWQRIDLRNHRKLLVVDGRVAWMGSQNIIERGYHHKPNRDGQRLLWKDLMLRVEGPMAVGVDAVFRNDWFDETGYIPRDGGDPSAAQFEAELAEAQRVAVDSVPTYDCQLVPSGPGYEHENNLRLFVQLLYQARERVVISSPYFAPDDSMLYALTTAAQRGIEVVLFVSERGNHFFTQHAQQSYYEALLRSGVQIWLYEQPYVLHSKYLTVDGEVSMVGSSNMDMRSFTLNAELMLIVYGKQFASELSAVEREYFAKSRQLTLDEWLTRGRMQVAIDDLCRLTSVVQ